MSAQVFISYSAPDRQVADAICSHLEADGLRCWIAPRDVLPGESYGKAIVAAIHSSQIMVLVFSATSNESPQVLREVERAVSRGLVLIPFRLEPVSPSENLEYFLSSPHWLDAMEPPLERHLESLRRTIQVYLERLAAKAARPATEAAPVLSALAVQPESHHGEPSRDQNSRLMEPSSRTAPVAPAVDAPSAPEPAPRGFPAAPTPTAWPNDEAAPTLAVLAPKSEATLRAWLAEIETVSRLYRQLSQGLLLQLAVCAGAYLNAQLPTFGGGLLGLAVSLALLAALLVVMLRLAVTAYRLAGCIDVSWQPAWALGLAWPIFNLPLLALFQTRAQAWGRSRGVAIGRFGPEPRSVEALRQRLQSGTSE